MKNVGYSSEIVDTYPKGSAVPFHMAGKGVGFLLQPFLDVVGNSLHLGVGVAFANDEVIGWRIIEFPHVELDDVFAFNILYAFNDQFV